MKVSLIKNTTNYNYYKTANYAPKISSLPFDSISFGVNRKERNYETVLTNIPKLPCACCGKIVIPENIFEKPLVNNYDVSAIEVLKA